MRLVIGSGLLLRLCDYEETIMRIKLKFAGLFGFAAVVALLAIAVAASAAGASEFKTNGTFPISALGEGLGLDESLSGPSTFLSEGLNAVTCEFSHSKGSVESSSKAKVTITYLGKCELIVEKSTIGKFKEACPTITTNELAITPLSKLNGTALLLGLLILPKTGTELAKFTCSGSNKVEVKVTGGVICESTPIGVLSKTGSVACREGLLHGAQEFTSGETPSGATVKTSLTAESKLSIFTVTEKDAQSTYEDLEYTNGEVEQTGARLITWEPIRGAQLTITPPAAKCNGQISVRNTGANVVIIHKENAFECKFGVKGCENLALNIRVPGRECISSLQEPGTKPEYELEVEVMGVKGLKIKFSV
jgi:hypothetical protein